MSNKYSDREIKEARIKLWHAGSLEWKLDPTQKTIYQNIKNTKSKVVVVNASRRLGKSYVLTVLAIEQCLAEPKSIVKFLQPEQKMIRTNVRPLMDKILQDCPKELKPSFKAQDNIYVFSNGSEIQLAGTDNGNHEKLRGGDCSLAIIDEAAFVKSELQYIVKSVLLPTTTLTRGKIVLSSTSPRESNHDFAKYMSQAEIKGTLTKKTIYDALEDQTTLVNPRITKEIIQEIIDEYPEGELSDEFRREYLCEIIQDGDNSVVPEFTAEAQESIITEWPRPPFCDKYVSMDIGFRDLTVVLFAYYDFENGVLVVEDEVVTRGSKMTTSYLAEKIIQKEKELWTDSLTKEFFEPYKRISDNNLIVINDLYKLHGILFFPTQKDNKDMQVNALRMSIASRQLIINPRCKTLIQHLKYANWDSNRKTFTRSADGAHYDAVDALLYLIRNVDKNRNPVPRGFKRYAGFSRDNFFSKEDADVDKYHEFKQIFTPITQKKFR